MNSETLPLEYVIKKSVKKAKFSPVIFMLHGYGSNEDDLFSFAEELPEEYTVISFRAPHSLPEFGYAWYAIDFTNAEDKWSDHEQAIASRDLLVDCFEKACQMFKLDKRNITLLGFSQGCILSLAIALSYPRLIKNVVGLSGYVNEDIIADDFRTKNHSALHAYVSNGTSDQVIPIDWARKTPGILQPLGVNLTYEEFAVGHGVSAQNFYSFREWLKSKL
ncbi:MAG: alpha/beta fold hydrolase [Capnocytophaga sp.]|nr:alpha/beta fold hydrolase [Capnocytophaga sp.]